METYIVLIQLNHDGVLYAPGSVVELPAETAAHLVNSSVVELPAERKKAKKA